MTNMIPKSILKKASTAAPVSNKEERDRETALYHANLIQHRKDIELKILLDTERLIDFPLSPLTTSTSPSADDVALFKLLLRPFQPSDYDCLIEERNINGHCGYALCRNPQLKDGGAGIYRITGKYGKAKDFKIVRKEELEKWCSDDCARRAMYVRVQLSDWPAWERQESTEEIEVMGEEKSAEQRRELQLAEDLRNLNLGEERKKKQGEENLALERGDRGMGAVNGLVGVRILEKDVSGEVRAPTLGVDEVGGRLDNMHLTLEGHTTRFESRGHQGGILHSMDDDEDDEDMDV